MSNFSVRRLLECLASDSSLRRQFRIDREAVLVNYLLEKAERDALKEVDADELFASLELAAPNKLLPSYNVETSTGIANPGIANPGIANPGIANPDIAYPENC